MGDGAYLMGESTLAVLSTFVGGFWWMVGVVIAGEAIWLAARFVRNRRRTHT